MRRRRANTSTTIAQATKENAPNLTREKKCWTSVLPTYSKVWSLTIKLWIGSLTLCIRATQTRSVSEKMRSFVCKKNKARFRIGLIGYTMIGLTVLLSRISLSESRASGDRHRNDLLIKLPNTKKLQMIMCKMVFAY